MHSLSLVMMKLGETAVTGSKAELLTADKVIHIKVQNKFLPRDTFKQLDEVRCKGNSPVVNGLVV